MRLLSALLLCLFSASALAADAPALLITKAGYYYVVTDDAGKPVLVQITNVVRIGDAPPNVPNPPDTPTPPPASNPTADLVKRLAGEVNDPAGAKALALVYRTIGDKHEKGEVKTEDVFPAIKAATDQVLAAINAGPKWAGFRSKLGEEITRKLQAGELQHPRDYTRFCADVAAGLEGSAPAETALSPELIQTIVQLILAVLSRLFGGAADSPV